MLGFADWLAEKSMLAVGGFVSVDVTDGLPLFCGLIDGELRTFLVCDRRVLAW